MNATFTIRIGNEPVMQNNGTVAHFTASMLRRGTKNRTYQQINDEFDRLKADVNIYGSGQTVNVTLQTIKENLIPALGVISEYSSAACFHAAGI